MIAVPEGRGPQLLGRDGPAALTPVKPRQPPFYPTRDARIAVRLSPRSLSRETP
jgi:hypothetical protein